MEAQTTEMEAKPAPKTNGVASDDLYEGGAAAADASEAKQDDAAAPQSQAGAPRVDISSLLGVVTGLMMESPLHKHLFLADMQWLVVPPVRLRQFRLFRRQGMPIAYASWAMLTEEAEARLKSGQIRLRPDEWNAGDRLWLIDVIAPFGGQEEIVKDLKQKVFEGKTVKMLQPAPDGLGLAVVEW